MAKILKLKNNADYFYDKAVGLMEDGKYFQAIDVFYRAYEKQNGYGADILLEIAACYKHLGEHEKAIDVYYKVLAVEPKNEFAYLGVITSLMELDKNDEAVYFINRCEDEGILGDDYEIDVSSRQGFQILDKYDKKAIIALARKLLVSGEYEYAKELLTQVPRQSPQYIEALNLIAMIYLGQEKYVNSALVCDEILSMDSDNIYALTTRAVAMYYLGNIEEVSKTIGQIERVDSTDKFNVNKVAVCMQQLERDDLALKYYLRLVKFKPYDRNTNLAIGILYHNLGESEKSHSTMVRLCRIYPADEVVKYYANALYYTDCKYKVLFDLPQSEQEKRLKEIELKLSKLKDVTKVTEYAKKHKEFHKLIRWLFFSDQVMFSGHVADFLAQHEYWHPLIREMLVSTTVNYMPKRECLGTFLRFADKKAFVLYIQDVLQFFKPRRPKCVAIAPYADHAYWNVYANLAFLMADYNKDINKEFKHFCKVTNNEYFAKSDDPAAFTALFAYMSGLHPLFLNTKTVCEIFGADQKKLDSYIIAYNASEGFDD